MIIAIVLVSLIWILSGLSWLSLALIGGVYLSSQKQFDWPGLVFILATLAGIGLIAYSIWRSTQC